MNGITLNLDATHKLVINGWCLAILTSRFVKYDSSDQASSDFAVHSSFPLLLSFARSEAQPTFDAMLFALKRLAHLPHDVSATGVPASTSISEVASMP